MNITNQLTEAQVQQVHGLYQNEWWTGARSFEQARQCIKGSQLIFAAIDTDFVIGFARVLTDYTFKALVFDLIINPDYRNKHIGKQILNAIKQHPDVSGVSHIELYCLPELFDYYRSHGFDNNVDGVMLMRLRNDK